MAGLYSAKLMDYFRRPRNQRRLAQPSFVQEGVNPLCGDRVRIEVLVDSEVVREAAFTANACALCVAAASVLTELVQNAPLDEVDTLAVDDLLRVLEARVPPARLNCIRLPLTVLHSGLHLYRKEHGLPTGERAAAVAAVVLAAGSARRFGAQKLLLPFGGSTVIRTVVEALLRSAVQYVAVVVGHQAEAMRSALEGLALLWVENHQPERGLSSSLAAGLGALPPNVGAALVVLGDQPTLDPGVVERLVERWRVGGRPVVAPRYRGVRGHPVLFSREKFADLAQLRGDVGAREYLAARSAEIELVDVPLPLPPDLDTPGDYELLLRRLRQPS